MKNPVIEKYMIDHNLTFSGDAGKENQDFIQECMI